MKYIKRFSHFSDSLTESNEFSFIEKKYNDFIQFVDDLNLKLIPIRQDFNLDYEVYFNYKLVSNDEGIINISLDKYKEICSVNNVYIINIDITKDNGNAHIPKLEELNDELKSIIGYFYNNDFTEGFDCTIYTKSNDRFGIQSRDIFKNTDTLDLFKPDPYSEYDEVDIIGIIIKND